MNAEPISGQNTNGRAALALFAILAALYLATASGLPDNPDAEVEFQTARSVWHDGSLALGDTPEARAIVAQHFDVAVGRDGRWYAWFGVGQALSALPFFALGRAAALAFPELEARHSGSLRLGVAESEYFEHLAVGLRNPLCGAALAVCVFLAALRWGATRRSAWVAALALGLATYLWPQSRSTLSDVPASLALVFAFERWLAWRASRRARDLALVGLALGACVATRIALLPAAGVFAVVVAAELYRARRGAGSALAFGLPIAAAASLCLCANFARFGSPFETGYGAALADGTFFSYPWYLGLLGVLCAPGKGLVFMASGLALAPIGWFALARRGERGTVFAVIVVALAVLAVFVGTQAWTGAYTYGPRYALPAVALAWCAVATALDHLRGLARAAALVVFAFGALVATAGVCVDHMTHQDLAVQAARVAWPDAGGATERERDDARFLAIQWDWRFAAPWAHWRILAHRLRTGDERFGARELFGLDSDAVFTPGDERERGFRHFAWVDLAERLHGATWPIWSTLAAVLAVGIALARTALAPRAGRRAGAGSS